MCELKKYKDCNVRIDDCMKISIMFINTILKKGHKTISCCCGHGKYPATILVESKGVVMEIFSGKIITRKRNFYKKDKQGYYFIPETIK